MLPFFLPRVPPKSHNECCQLDDPDAALNHACAYHNFSLRCLAWAIQTSADAKTIRHYLKWFSAPALEKWLCSDLAIAPGGPFIPILYFAVERNSPDIVRLLCHAGASPSQRMRPLGLPITKLPLLAYAVLSAEYDLSDTTDTVISLLASGASPSDLPKDMWEEYLKAPTKDSPAPATTQNTHDSWCTAELREALCRTLNLIQRYVLWKAAATEQQTPRMKAIAAVHSLTPLFESHYYIIGQRRATEHAIHSITDYIMFGDTKPLVLLFTGPSGHGKTELARRMGTLLSLEMHTVDGTAMKHETDIFGPQKPYEGYDKGAPLNNFLWDNAGERAVVFVDELDKASEETRNAMLKLFEEGMYEDRRTSTPVDCSKIIWILAANLGTELIQKFWTNHLKDRSEEQQKRASYASFERSLEQTITNSLGAPFAGRLSSMIPFMPFNTGEQAVTTFKFMQNLWTDVRKPINVDAKQFPRHLFVDYRDDGAIATFIAGANYSSETGARPLEVAVKREIRGRLSRVFFQGEEVVEDKMNDRPLENYEVRMTTVEEDIEEISVALQGTKQLQLRIDNNTPSLAKV